MTDPNDALDALTVDQEAQVMQDVFGHSPAEALLAVYARRGLATFTDVIQSTPEDPGWVTIDGAEYPSPSQSRYRNTDEAP